jgi:hypothetical protein
LSASSSRTTAASIRCGEETEELFYLQPGATAEFISVPVGITEPGQGFAFGDREVVLDWPTTRAARVAITMSRSTASGVNEVGATNEITVVLNWFT